MALNKHGHSGTATHVVFNQPMACEAIHNPFVGALYKYAFAGCLILQSPEIIFVMVDDGFNGVGFFK